MLLSGFDPDDVDSDFLVNREDDVRWLDEGLSAYLKDDRVSAGRSICVLGEKGAGKSILTRAAIRRAEAQFSQDTLILKVDCRARRNPRDVFRSIAQAAARVTVRQRLLRRQRASASAPTFGNRALRLVQGRGACAGAGAAACYGGELLRNTWM